MQRTLGIDLGTTNSVMAYIKKGGPQVLINSDNSDLTPSVVAPGRRGELLVGARAKARRGQNPANTIASIKRFMGRRFDDEHVQQTLQLMNPAYPVFAGPDGDVRVQMGGFEYSPVEISAIILRRLKEEAESRVGEPFSRAVITVPAYFGERQVAATRDAGRMAGFNVLRIINEPTAAALAYGLDRDDSAANATILVYDLGGGTFDISILMLIEGTFTVLGIEGDNLLGGDDFDHAIVRLMLAEIERGHGVDLSGEAAVRATLAQHAEATKIALSSQLAAEVIVPALGSAAVTLETEVTRAVFEEMIRVPLERTITLTDTAIRNADLSPEVIDQVLLVGGSTSIPLAQQFLRATFGDAKIRRNANPMQCVALGAAIQGSIIAELQCPACEAVNPVQAECCAACTAPLDGGERRSCPTCFIPSPVTETACRKCGSSFAAAAAAPVSFSVPAAVPSAPPPEAEKCPKCGTPYRAGSDRCAVCQTSRADDGGLQCPACGATNVQGATACSSCGNALGVTFVLDITPKDIGIELDDGSFSVIIPKGTVFPLEPTGREYHTVAGQRRMEVVVYEGDGPLARQNEFLGIVLLHLPENLPARSPVSIALGLDKDRAITVKTQIRAQDAGEREVKLRRSPIDQAQVRTVEEQRQKLLRFLDQWEEELTDAERADVLQMIEFLDHYMSDGAGDAPIAEVLSRAARLEDLSFEIRGTSANLGNTMNFAGRYLSAAQQEDLQRRYDAIGEARRRGDWDAGERLYPEADRAINELGETIRVIVNCRHDVAANKLPPALSQEVNAVLRGLDEALESGQEPRIAQAVQAVWTVWEKVANDRRSRGDQVPALTFRPTL